MNQLLPVVILSLASVGCVSTTTKFKEPIPFDSEYSYAYNIALQTTLTDGSSKLKDVSKDDIDKISKLSQGEAGSASIFFGTLSFLTGDFASAAIDVTGGAVSNLASSNHESGNPRWIITLDKNILNPDAYIYEQLNNAFIKTLGDKFKTVDITLYDGTMTSFVVGGKCVEPSVEGTDESLLTYSGKNANNENWCWTGIKYNPNKPFYSEVALNGVNNTTTLNYGFNVKYEQSSPFGALSFTTVFDATESKELSVNYYKFIAEMTTHLPSGFYYYKSNFTAFRDFKDRKMYTLSNDILPAIYHDGNVYEFIEPNS